MDTSKRIEPAVPERPPVTRRAFLRTWATLPAALVLSAYAGAATPVLATWKQQPSAQSGPVARAMGLAGSSELVASCVLTPQMTEGPYFVDEMLNRSDIRSDPADGTVKDGLPLRLTLQVSQLTGGNCAPLTGATVDIWHCDALGEYSDVTDRTVGFSTPGQKFLRGYQVSDASGAVQFTTIYPGWYMGRTVHIHFKVRTDPGSATGYEATSQLFFDDAITDQVHAQPPYAAKGQRDLRNAADGIFQNGGDQLVLPLVADAGGYAATFGVVVDLTAPAATAVPGGRPPGPPPATVQPPATQVSK